MAREKAAEKEWEFEEDKINADSTEGKNKRVCAPVLALCQAEFQRDRISERNTLFLCRPTSIPAGASEVKILAGEFRQRLVTTRGGGEEE